jgi:hypothetical protein
MKTVSIIYEGWYESNTSNFFSENIIAINNEIHVDDSYIFYDYEAIFPQSLNHFQHTLPKLS